MKAECRSAVATGLLLLSWVAVPVLAHHSFAAEYDASKPVTLSGAVTTLDWMNPHVRFHMDVKDEHGKITDWELTMGGPGILRRNGWTRNLLKPGETITVNGYLAKDGSRLANIRLVILNDGRRLFGGAPPEATIK